MFGKKPKDDRSKLEELAKLWHFFETVELDQPHIEKKLKDFAARIAEVEPDCRKRLEEAGASDRLDEVDLLFDVLTQLPEPPAGWRETAATLTGDQGFSWERAQHDLGIVARLADGVRVFVQQGTRRKWESNIESLEKRLAPGKPQASSPPPDGRAGKLQAEIDHVREELEKTRQAERSELLNADDDFRRYLADLCRLYELYETGLKALIGVKTPDGEQKIIATLRSEDARYRNLAYKILRRRNWQPQNAEDRLDFSIVPARNPETEAEASRKIQDLIRSTTDIKTLLGVIEPRLAEEGLTELQAALLEHLCDLHSEKALDRLGQVLESSLDPPALKVKVAEALPDIGTPRAVEMLIKAMDELDMDVRSAAAGALGRVGQGTGDKGPGTRDQGLEPILAAARDRLAFALRDGDVSVREAAAKALRHYPDAAGQLARMVVEERNPNAREYSALALKNFAPSPQGSEALTKALSDEDAAVRHAAADALAGQQQVPEDPDLRIRFLCARQSWKELRKVGLPATACLKGLLRDRNEDVRLSVVELLGDLRAKDAVRDLGVSLADSSQTVRKQAAVALRLIGDPSALDALRSALAKEGFREVKAEIEKTIARLQGRAA